MLAALLTNLEVSTGGHDGGTSRPSERRYPPSRYLRHTGFELRRRAERNLARTPETFPEVHPATPLVPSVPPPSIDELSVDLTPFNTQLNYDFLPLVEVFLTEQARKDRLRDDEEAMTLLLLLND